MGKFRKRPVVIEAFEWSPDWAPRWNPRDGHVPPDAVWFLKGIEAGVIRTNDDGSCTIRTLEGDHRADPGDWIIRGVKGEMYPCKPDIFAMTYEVA